jgi:hypothetical protein
VRALVLIATLLCASCGLTPERVSHDDPRLKPLLDAMARVDRRALGFTPLERQAELRVEWAGGLGRRLGLGSTGYDAMLHVSGKTSRTVAFKQTRDGYDWLGEQEVFTGPRTYTSVDGTFHETITITYERAPITGFPLNTVAVVYQGEDAALAWPRKLDLETVRPWLKRWGYD